MTQEERIRRMKEAGIPMPITQMPLSEGSTAAIPVTSSNVDKHARLQALKSGANKHVVQALVTSKSQQQGFEGIPEPKQKRRPQGHPNQGNPVQTVAVENNFGPVAPISGELAALEAMMGGGSPAYNPPIQQTNVPQTSQPELSVNQEGYGPDFNPAEMLAKKRQQMQQNQYMKFAQEETVNNALAPFSQETINQQQNFDFQNMQKMMEQIAKNTMSEVLNNYADKNKDKLVYEKVNVKTQDGTQVIKTQDGKYYKLVPVKIKS